MEKSSNAENKRVQAVKKLMKREGLRQIDLADALNMEPQNFSRILVTGKVSDKTCRKIHDLYPEYRLEFLLGYDDDMTFEDVIEHSQLLKDKIADGMWAIIEKSLSRQGKSLRFVHRQNDPVYGSHINSTQRLKADCYYSIIDSKTGSEVKRLTALELVQFEQKIQEYCDFMTDRYL